MDRYTKFFERTFVAEGGFQNNPNDKGNYYNGKLYGTIYGITARDYFDAYSTIKILYDKSLFIRAKEYAMEFYRNKGYWNYLYEKIKDEAVAFKLFDFGVNAGPKRAVKLLQAVLVGLGHNLEIDGEFGVITLGVVNKEVPDVLYQAYIERLEKYYKSLKGFKIFGIGWLKRLFKRFK